MPNYNSKKKPKHTQFEPPPPYPPQGFDPLPNQRVPSLVLLRNPVLANQP